MLKAVKGAEHQKHFYYLVQMCNFRERALAEER